MIRTACVVLTMAGLAAPAVGQQFIEVELILESFDGCGCIPLDPPLCPECHDLDGQGCNVHEGITNDPHAGCPFGGVVPWPHPNYDFFGPQSIDQDWSNIGGTRDFGGDFGIKAPTPAGNQASQSFLLQSGTFIKSAWPWEDGALGYIDPNTPQDIVGNIYGRMHIEDIRAAYNAAHPDAPLPEPLFDQPTRIELDIRRVGGGGTSGGELVLNPAIGAVGHNPDPTGLAATYHRDHAVPADATWHTYNLVDLDKYPLNIYMGLHFEFKIPDGQGGYLTGTTTENVTIWMDNLKLVYTAVNPDACPHDPVFDYDDDGDVDQDDYAVLQACFTGPNYGGTLTPECRCYDATGPEIGVADGSVDQQDVIAFEACASGPFIPADPDCDNP